MKNEIICARFSAIKKRRDVPYQYAQCKIALCMTLCFETYHTKKDITKLHRIDESYIYECSESETEEPSCEDDCWLSDWLLSGSDWLLVLLMLPHDQLHCSCFISFPSVHTSLFMFHFCFLQSTVYLIHFIYHIPSHSHLPFLIALVLDRHSTILPLFSQSCLWKLTTYKCL